MLSAECFIKNPLVKYHKGTTPELELNIPFVSAIMQSVSDHKMAIALAKNGGLSFIFGSQSIETQCEMVRKVKKFKAGFVCQRCQPDSGKYLKRCPCH